jgi:protein-disulfide isomerase
MRFVLVGAVVVLAVIVAVVLDRRKPEAPTQARWAVPAQLDRADFGRPSAPWLVAVFTSATCDSCAKAMDQARVLASDEVAVEEVEVGARPEVHRRYHVDAVPTIVVADDEGVVRASFVGPPTATDLWAAVAEARQPGSSPEPDLGRPNT